MIKVKRRSKYGTTTLFLAIILSAVILVECTYLAFVWDLDRRMQVSRALKCQAETILAGYDRTLFDTYGIYGFSLENADDLMFRKALDINGTPPDDDLFVDDLEILDDDSLRKAITSYYLYRGGAVAIDSMADQVASLLKELDKTGALKKLRSVTGSRFSGYIDDILSGSGEVTSKLEELRESMGDEEYEMGIGQLESLRSILDDSGNDLTGLGISLDLTDLDLFVRGYSNVETMISRATDLVAGRADHLMLAHYAANNFDCIIDNDNDTSIIGTKFKDIHGENYLDCEYMMTGLDGRLGFANVSYLVLQLLFAKNFLAEYSGVKTTMIYETLSILLSSLIALISAGTVDIPPDVMQLIIVLIISVGNTVDDFSTLLDGGKVPFFKEDDLEMIYLGYRDFLFIYLYCQFDKALTSRMLKILERDFGQIYTGIVLSTGYRGTTYDITKRYELYE